MRNMCNVKSETFSVKRDLYERVVLPKMMQEAKFLEMTKNGRQKLEVREMKSSRSKCRVIRLNRGRSEDV